MGTDARSTGGKDHASLTEVAAKLNSLARAKWHLPDDRLLPALMLISDDTRLPDPAGALAALPRGSGFIFRHYDDPYREKHAEKLIALAHSRGIVFLVAGDIDLARRLGADGCHMPEHRVAELAECRGATGFHFNTAAAHSREALQEAGRCGAHAALLSPVFPTASHPGSKGLGVCAATRLARAAPLPVYALGGINRDTVHDLLGGPFAGLAAIDGLTVAR